MKKYMLTLCVLTAIVNLNAQKSVINYKKVFGKDYTAAERYISENPWIRTGLEKENIKPAFAIAIVFPEIIRYSAILNIIESSALKTLYIQNGEKYADFSIGYFQMKPSFAETIENINNKILQKAGHKTGLFNTNKTVAARKERILRLDNAQWQLRYLILFIKIMNAKYSKFSFDDEIEKLKFYATAYNFGFTSDFSTINKHTSSCSFYTELFANSESKYYCYSDISIFYYKTVTP
ncbi:MAG TPA: hypothetical protein PLL66_09375 [Bacteroidales bacterium]|nr:hypothetical protein [Bacteroidales bacterium]